MRKLTAVVLLVALAACGGGGGTEPIANGTLFFKIDALTCTGTDAVTFFIDGSAVGTETLSAGQTSRGYTTSAASHVAGARTPTYLWPNTTITVPANGSITDVLPCG